MQITTQQTIQEDQYNFPYHYIPSLDNGYFSSSVYWSWGINYLCTMEFLIERIQCEKFSKLIDVGCGDGRFIRELSLHFEKNLLLGVDISQRAINLAKALNPDLDFQKLDIMNSKLQGDYDVLTLIEVFEHIPIEEASLFLSSIASLQQTGGHLYITVPHTNKPVQKKHFQHFNSTTLEKYIRKFYEIKEFIYFDKKTRYLRYLRGLLKNRFFILNHTRTLNLFYKYFKKNLFICSESECTRIGVIAIKK